MTGKSKGIVSICVQNTFQDTLKPSAIKPFIIIFFLNQHELLIAAIPDRLSFSSAFLSGKALPFNSCLSIRGHQGTLREMLGFPAALREVGGDGASRSKANSSCLVEA